MQDAEPQQQAAQEAQKAQNADQQTPSPTRLPTPPQHTNIPAIIHLLHPDAPVSKWAAVHPAHMIKVWTKQELEVCARLVPEVAKMNTTESVLIDALVLLYLFGGTAVCHAREPKKNVLGLLMAYPSTVVLLTSPPDGTRIDTDRGVVAATARIKAFRALFALLEANNAGEERVSDMVKEFFAASMQASKGDTIRVVSAEVVEQIFTDTKPTVTTPAPAPPAPAAAPPPSLPPLPSAFLEFAASRFGEADSDVDVQVVESGGADDAEEQTPVIATPLVRAVANAVLTSGGGYEKKKTKDGAEPQKPCKTFAILDDGDFDATTTQKSETLIAAKFRTLLPTLMVGDYVCIITHTEESRLAAASAAGAPDTNEESGGGPKPISPYGIGRRVALQLRMLGAELCLPQETSGPPPMIAVWRVTDEAVEAASVLSELTSAA